MAASWLKNYLAPIRFLVAGIAQVRDDRVNFGSGFVASQVLDADGLPVLTIDNSAANTSYEPTANTIPIRNGSGTLKGNVITATSYTYTTPKTITYKEPIRVVDPGTIDPVTGWSLNSAQELEANALSLQWLAEITPPIGSTLKTISVVYTPSAPGAHAGLPADQPSIELLAIVEGVAPVGAYDSAQDNAVDLTAYEAKRTLTLTLGTPIVIAEGTRYWLQFNAETGANAMTGNVLHVPAKWTAEVMSV